MEPGMHETIQTTRIHMAVIAFMGWMDDMCAHLFTRSMTSYPMAGSKRQFTLAIDAHCQDQI